MAQPEQSRPNRTGRTDLDARARSTPEARSGPDQLGPEPEANQPGHHPEHEQDKPPLDEFAARLGITPEGGAEAPAPPGEEVGAGERERSADRHDRGGHRLPGPARTVWVLTARCGVLPTLRVVRSAAEVAERAVRRSIG